MESKGSLSCSQGPATGPYFQMLQVEKKVYCLEQDTVLHSLHSQAVIYMLNKLPITLNLHTLQMFILLIKQYHFLVLTFKCAVLHWC